MGLDKGSKHIPVKIHLNVKVVLLQAERIDGILTETKKKWAEGPESCRKDDRYITEL